MRIRIDKKVETEIRRLLTLDDDNLRQNRIGKLIREDFNRRGWLKGKVRGRPLEKRGF